jgi:hypothetical protein
MAIIHYLLQGDHHAGRAYVGRSRSPDRNALRPASALPGPLDARVAANVICRSIRLDLAPLQAQITTLQNRIVALESKITALCSAPGANCP